MAEIDKLNLNVFTLQNLKLIKVAKKSLLIVYKYYYNDEIDKHKKSSFQTNKKILQKFVRDFNVEKIALFKMTSVFERIWNQANCCKLKEKFLS